MAGATLDLNPTENVWKMMKDTLQKRIHEIKAFDDIKKCVQGILEPLDVEKLDKFIDSMLDRIRKVVNSKGGSTRW